MSERQRGERNESSGHVVSNKAFEGAKKKGRRDRDRGFESHQHPYQDIRTLDGKITWARAFIEAWGRGWVERDMELRAAGPAGRKK